MIAETTVAQHLKKMWQTPGWLFDSEGAMLALLADNAGPNATIVEIGSFQGKSAVMLAGGNPQATVYCVDPFDSTQIEMYTNLISSLKVDSLLSGFKRNTSDYPNIVPMVGFSMDIVKTWTRPIDVLFIDGDHSYDAVRNDVEYWLPFLKPGGALAMHDVRFPTDPAGPQFDPDPIRVICDLGLGYVQNGWSACLRVESLFVARKDTK